MSQQTGGMRLDRRFAWQKDPRFKPVPKKVQKTVVDERFSKLFTDDRFRLSASRDPYGRKKPRERGEDLSRLYALEKGKKGTKGKGKQAEEEEESDQEKDEEDENESEEEVGEEKGGMEGDDDDDDDDGDEDEDEDEDDDEEEDEEDEDARGPLSGKQMVDEEGQFVWEEQSSSEEKDSEDAESSDEETSAHKKKMADETWDTVQNDVEEGESSRRLAVMGLDWENVAAVDLLVMLESFLGADKRKAAGTIQQSGRILKVSVYPSDFGLEQMKLEDERGPQLDLPLHILKNYAARQKRLEEEEDRRLKSGLKSLKGDASRDYAGKEDGGEEGSSDEDEDMEGEGEEESVEGDGEEEEEEEDADEEEEEEEDQEDEDTGGIVAAPGGKPLFSDSQEEEAIMQAALRKYQKNRTKYYYAIVECLDIQTAEDLYGELDGIDVDIAVDGMDLRFVPDGQEFPHPPRDTASKIPKNYQKPESWGSALRHSSVKCTWDETPANRTRLLRRKFSAKDLADMDLRNFVGSDEESSSDEEEQGAGGGKKGGFGKITENNLEDYRRALLGDAVDLFGDEEEDKRKGKKGKGSKSAAEDADGDVDMEVSFNTDLEKWADDVAARVGKGKGKASSVLQEGEEKSPWELYLDKKKREKKERRQERKEKAKGGNKSLQGDSEEEEEGDEEGDDDSDDLLAHEKKAKKKRVQFPLISASGKGAGGSEDSDEDSEEERGRERERQDLELLMGDEEDDGAGGRHFDLRPSKEKKGSWKERMKEKRKEAKEKKQRLQKALMAGSQGAEGRRKNETAGGITETHDAEMGTAAEGGFKVDIADPRLAKLFNHADFAMDPTNPAFKKSEESNQFLAARRKKGREGKLHGAGASAPSGTATSSAVANGSSLLPSDSSGSPSSYPALTKKKKKGAADPEEELDMALFGSGQRPKKVKKTTHPPANGRKENKHG